MDSHPRPRCLMLTAALVLLTLPGIAAAETQVKHEGDNWAIENQRLRVTVDAKAGRMAVLDKSAGCQWRQVTNAAGKAEPKFRGVREVVGSPRGIAFEADFPNDGKWLPLQVTLTLPDDSSDLSVTADMPQRDTEIRWLPFLEPLVSDTSAGALAVADYSNGHLYPLDLKPFPRGSFEVSRLDMPWVGVCDLQKGTGYALIVETTDDASLEMRTVTGEGREWRGPRLVWQASKKTFAYARKYLYHFSSSGGYVALAKRYREYAKQLGLVVPFAEKLKKNPNLSRLFGAPDVWGNASLAFAKEAKAAGVDKMLIHGRCSPADMKAVNELGYLTSEYDNYTDVLPIPPGKSVDSNHDLIPENVVLKADGQRLVAWLTFDKKTQYMKRCPAMWVATAKQVVPKLLEKQPFLGRFIDVTTAEWLYECYDPKHPLTREAKRQCGVDLLSYVRSLGLVMGGEHGIWWSVPHLDYIEGMMSGGSYSWPAGHLLRPKSKDQEFISPQGHKLGKWENYERWGIGHEYRIPLWELVFHDCIVSTWYWGDASDFLLKAAPEITPKKDAFNILYGSIPLLWANKEGGWTTARDVFLRTYRNTCKLHEAIAGTEMLSHEFVTPDRAVQRTRFSDGTEVVVNFGQQPYTAEVAGKKYVLPQNGFAVKGPKIEQSLTLVDGKPVTTIRTEKYQFTDAK
ncbi:MAG: glycoside hydrolase [Thermoguttaceae bacterium]